MKQVTDLLAKLKKKEYSPIYFFQGEEAYYIDQLSDYIEDHVLNEGEKSFNQSVFYGKDSDIMTILNSARRFPMMSDYQVILVKEAQHLKFKIEDQKDPLVAYLENPLKSTILVFCYKYGSLDKRLKFAKILEKHAEVVTTKKLYDDAIPGWIDSYLSAKKIKIEQSASNLLAEYLGTDLSKIANELDKLILVCGEGHKITTSDIEKNIGISKEYNVFELQKAIGRRDLFRSQQIAAYFAANPKQNNIVQSIGSLINYFIKLLTYHAVAKEGEQKIAAVLKVNPYFLKDYQIAARNYNFQQTQRAIHLLHEYDVRSKGVGTTGEYREGDLLKELLVKVMI